MKTTAVVPVHNEEKTVVQVLKVLNNHPRINEIIAVDDGSTDKTPQLLKNFSSKKLKVISLASRQGKGNAIKIATKDIECDVILFFDADLTGLSKSHVDTLLDPIGEGASMAIGLRDRKSLNATILIPYYYLISGQRSILKEIFMKIRKSPHLYGWGIESVMNDYCKKKNLRVEIRKLDGLDHISKIHKLGVLEFAKEVMEIIATKFKLRNVKYLD